MEEYQIGDQILFLDEKFERNGIIKNIDYSDNTIQICGVDNTLYLASIDVILYKFNIK